MKRRSQRQKWGRPVRVESIIASIRGGAPLADQFVRLGALANTLQPAPPPVTPAPPAQPSADRAASVRTTNFPPSASLPAPRPGQASRPARPNPAFHARPIARPAAHLPPTPSE